MSRSVSSILIACGWLILLVTAAGKIGGLLWPTQGKLLGLDPLLGIPTVNVVVTAAAVELAACCAFFKLPNRLRALVLSMFGLEFLLYHLVLHLSGYRGACPCLGGLWTWTGLSEASATRVAFWLSVWLLGSGLIALTFEVRQKSVFPVEDDPVGRS